MPCADAPTKKEGTEKDGAMSLVDRLSTNELLEMRAAGAEIHECYRVLERAKLNIVGEMLKGQGEFFTLEHYPKGDVYDDQSHAQFYYHSHRPESGEHGHFHTFIRAAGMPKGMRPAPYLGTWARPLGKDALTHLVAISMDNKGYPTHLFTCNRWVTGETFYRAEDIIPLLDRFEIDHAYPCWPTNRWLGAMFRLFKQEIAELLLARDRTVADWEKAHPDRDVFEDRELDLTSLRPISVDAKIEEVERALAKAA